MTFDRLASVDPEVANALAKELQRQREGLELIPSENYVSAAVLDALGSIATNKYAEGYPGARYYGGTQYIDIIEQLAIDRAKNLFGAEHVNVQPLSGAPMNLAVYTALLAPGDTVLGMDLSHGGHLTHGHPVTFPAKIFRFIRYACDPETGEIDYDAMHAIAKKERPKIVLAGFSSYSREIDYERMNAIAHDVGAVSMMDMAHIAGLVAGGVAKNPVPIMDIVTTTTHKSLRGPRGGMILCKKEFAKKIDKAVFPGLQGGPHENQIAALAVALQEAARPDFRAYAGQILRNAQKLCEVLQEAHYRVLFGGTDNHLILVDVTPLGLGGKEAQHALDDALITVNKNVIPNDARSPMDPSGIRMGTPAVTTRGMKEREMEMIGDALVRVLQHPHDVANLAAVRDDVRALTQQFPLYHDSWNT